MRRRLINLDVPQTKVIDTFVECDTSFITKTNDTHIPEPFNIYHDGESYCIVYECKNCGQNVVQAYTFCPYCGEKPNWNVYSSVDHTLYDLWKSDKVKAQVYIIDKNLCRTGVEGDTLTFNYE